MDEATNNSISLEPLRRKAKKQALYSIDTLLRKRRQQEKWEYEEEGTPLLRRVLTWFDVLSCSICMTIGAGIFVITGLVAEKYAGPAVIISLLFSGVSALISSFCYSEFAARVPVSGSTYSFAYISLGEFMAWMVGWITIIQFAIGSAIAKGIARLCVEIAFVIHIKPFEEEDNTSIILANVLIILLTILVIFGGIKGAALFCRIVSVINVTTIIFIIIAGSIYVDTTNWSKFAPFGFSGIVKGAARVLFAYIGFENSLTLTTEVKDPKKSIPGGVIGTMAITITLYLSSSLIITGMADYKTITSESPFVDAFKNHDAIWAAGIVGFGSLLCMTTTMFTSLLGLPRILYQMAKDGLLSEHFAKLNRFRVPYVGTLMISTIACILTFALKLEILNDMICCGVLINYTLIDLGVISLRFMDSELKMQWKYMLLIGGTGLSCLLFGFSIDFPQFYAPIIGLIPFAVCIAIMYKVMPVSTLASPPNVESFLCPMVPFLPCLGMLLNIAMVVQLEIIPLVQVIAWVTLGSIVYFAYGIRNSKLNFIDEWDKNYSGAYY